jgi:hypothetical protein
MPQMASVGTFAPPGGVRVANRRIGRHVRKRACASLISDVYIQEGTRMLAVSRCWVSDHAAIASKSEDTKAAALDEVGGPEHGRTIP